MGKDYSKLSPKCEQRIKGKPNCGDSRAVRGWVSCNTFKLILDDMKKKNVVPSSMRDILRYPTYKQRLNESWNEARKACGR